MVNKSLKVPNQNPKSLKVGSIKMKNYKYFMVKKTSNGKKWVKADKTQTKCHNYLKQKIGENMKEFEKKKRYSSRSQAIAVSYSQTKKKFNKCNLQK